MSNAPSSGPATSNRGGAILESFRAPEWGLVAGIAAVLGVTLRSTAPARSSRRIAGRRCCTRSRLFGVLSVGAAVVIIPGASTFRSVRWWRSVVDRQARSF